MHLIRNWACVLQRAWSVRLMALAFVLSGLEVTIQVMIAFALTPPFIAPGVFALLAGLVTMAAMIARFVSQGL